VSQRANAALINYIRVFPGFQYSRYGQGFAVT
jgi:hypothetical protein